MDLQRQMAEMGLDLIPRADGSFGLPAPDTKKRNGRNGSRRNGGGVAPDDDGE